MKPILFIDLDNVVYDTVSTIKTLYDEDFCLYDDWVDIPVEKIKSYNFTELKLLTEERLNEYFCSGRFFDALNYIEGSESSIRTLNSYKEFPVMFASIGTHENIKGKKDWVQGFNKVWSANAGFIGVHSFDKSEINMSGGILIDDELKNLNSSNADIKICFGDYEWNKEWTGLRAKNWKEVNKLIYEEAKKYESKD